MLVDSESRFTSTAHHHLTRLSLRTADSSTSRVPSTFPLPAARWCRSRYSSPSPACSAKASARRVYVRASYESQVSVERHEVDVGLVVMFDDASASRNQSPPTGNHAVGRHRDLPSVPSRDGLRPSHRHNHLNSWNRSSFCRSPDPLVTTWGLRKYLFLLSCYGCYDLKAF